jgi:hypothetical protein
MTTMRIQCGCYVVVIQSTISGIADQQKTSTDKQKRGKPFFAATNYHTEQKPSEDVFSKLSVPRLFKELQLAFCLSSKGELDEREVGGCSRMGGSGWQGREYVRDVSALLQAVAKQRLS